MTSARQVHYTYVEYLTALKISELRLEYLAGEIFAMAGGTPEHGMISARIIQLLGAILPSTCRVMTSDVRIRIQATGLATFPDVSVVCGEVERAADDPHAVVNPVVLVEVLSPSTRDYDAGEKLRHYQQIPSARVVLLVEPDAPRVQAVTRTENGWRTTEHEARVPIAEFGELSVTAIYG